MFEHEEVLSQLTQDPNIEKAMVKKAIEFAVKYHAGQTRDSGEPYHNHPIEVALILSQMQLDTASIVTALLHDTVEDTELTLEEIEKHFSSEIAFLVDGVSKLKKVKLTKEQVSQAENFRKLLLAMVKDMRVLLVKLADRLHNMRTIFAKSSTKRAKISLETLEIYAPLAERIGVNKIKSELQEISFANLYPDVYNMVINKLNEISANRQLLLQNIIQELKDSLSLQQINAQVMGRAKSPYSIWTKMVNKNTSFDNLFDIIGFRILVDSIPECYKTLGAIHAKYRNIPGTFHDFISSPKPNGYQSLHTVLLGPLGRNIEVQIRTRQMHEMAELGFASHWVYKQNYHSADIRNYRWIREIVSILEHSTNAEEVLQHTKLAMYEDQIFCLTPKGDIVSLPKKATPIDFAYALHSNLGHHCIGVKINGKLSPLKNILKTGDLVEIITSKNQSPLHAWEDIVVTGKAKSEIRRFLKNKETEGNIRLGKSLLEGAFLAAKIQGMENIIPSAAIRLNKTIDDLYLSVAKGEILAEEILELVEIKKQKSNTFFKLIRGKKIDSLKLPISGLVPGVLIHFAKCCHPIAGDKIVGIVNSGKGVTIHISDCKSANHLSHQQKFNLNWQGDNENYQYITKIRLIAKSDPHVMSIIAAKMSDHKIGLINLEVKKLDEFFNDIICSIEVAKLDNLNNLIASLQSEKLIYAVSRIRI